MLNLLLKDFKLMLGSKQSLSQRIISAFFAALFFGAVIVVEVFLFRTILNTIGNIKGATSAFLTVFLCVTTVIITVSDLFNAKRLFFDDKDIEQLSPRPVTNGQIILSKMLFLFLIHYFTSILFEYPVLFAYGEMIGKPPLYFFTALFYPVATFLFEAGIALLLVYPLWLLSNLLKKHFLVKLIVSFAVIVALSFAYSYVLDVFIKLVSKNGLILLFSKDSIAKMIDFKKYAFPVNFLTDIFVNKSARAFFPFIFISAGIFGMGVAVAVFAFNYVRNVRVYGTIKSKKHAYKPVSVTKALIKKEITLICKNSDYVFSFTGLLVVQPLLLTFVIRSMNAALSAGSIQYFAALVPGLVSYVDILFVMLFTVVINQGANSYVTMEEKTVKNMKTIPVPFSKQLFIKVAIPFTMSLISLFASSLTLILTAAVTVKTGIFAFAVSVLLLFIFDVVSLWEELNIRHGKPRSTFVSSVISYLLPVCYAVVAILLSYEKISDTLTLLGGIATIIILGAFPVYYVFKNAGRLFLGLEAIN